MYGDDENAPQKTLPAGAPQTAARPPADLVRAATPPRGHDSSARQTGATSSSFLPRARSSGPTTAHLESLRARSSGRARLPTRQARGGVRYGSGGSELQRQDRPHSPACRGGSMLGRTRFRAGAAEKRHDGRIHVAHERRVRWPVQMLWSPRPLYDDRGCSSSHDVPLQASRLRRPTTL